MYQTSHNSLQYSSGLEHIANSYSAGVAYSAATIPVYMQPSVSNAVGVSNILDTLKAVSSTYTEVPANSYLPASQDYIFTPQNEYLFQPENFLKAGKGTRFIGKAEEIRGFIEEAFVKIFDKPFPDIRVSLLDETEFRKVAPNPFTVGMSINRGELLSEIFVLQDTLGKVMLTIGHELGHVLSPTLSNPVDEEAKAYAFSWLWMEVIKENNIAGLGNAFVSELPAENGLHDVAYRFVMNFLKEGKSCLNLYNDILCKKIFSISS